MKVVVKWEEGASFLAETESGHRLRMDGLPEHGGRNLGPRPMEALLMAAGACSAFYVVHILRKGRQEMVDCRLDIDADRSSADPKVFTHLRFHYLVSGRNLQSESVRRAIAFSADKYCSASIMLSKTADISFDFEIQQSPEKVLD